MNKKAIYTSLLSFIMFLPYQSAAIEKSTQGVLSVFKRYEVEFSNNKRRLEEYARKLGSNEHRNDEDLRLSADDLMEHAQKRYEMLEDQYSFTASEYPQDRSVLREGFEFIEEKYREIREIYDERIKKSSVGSSESANNKKLPKHQEAVTDVAVAEKTSEKVGKNLATKPQDKNIETKESKKAKEAGNKTESVEVAKPKRHREVNISGSYSIEVKDRTEKTRAQNLVRAATPESKLPNDFSQFKLSLNYEHDDNHSIYVDEKFIQRERNELVRENYLDFAYVVRENYKNAWMFKNSFRINDYLDAELKDYREDLFEITNERTPNDRRDGTTTFGYQTRRYPHYSNSDFNQFNLNDSETFLMTDSMFVGEANLESRQYKYSENLDYDNANLFFEFNKKFDDDSEITVSNTYDRRDYKHEAVGLYRTSYYDNFFRFDYVIPSNEKITYEFEAQHNKHEYGSDYERGYSELDLMLAARMKLNDSLRAQLDYKYIDNDENSRILAQKNNEAHLMLLKTVNPVLKIRFDHNFHKRESVVGDTMNFDENISKLKFSWQINKETSIAWNTEYNGRTYDVTQYEDYRSYSTGLDLRYVKRNSHEWRAVIALKRMEFRNFYREGAVLPDSDWQGESQPSFSVEYIKPINKDLKLVSSFSYEKTYYRSYDTYMQDLIWDFAKPMIIREFDIRLERKF